MSREISKREVGQTLVQNSELVLNAFDYWPAFHDSEVVTFCKRMAEEAGRHVADATIAVRHGGQDNPEWTASGEDRIVEFLCRDIAETNINLNELSGGGWLDEIVISTQNNGRLGFDMRPLAGFDVRFSCRSVEILAVGLVPSA
ncbi:Imm50 family immunity protein [Cupriavidus basilensis]|uniref:Imm50 family immunity protein n=1 Tax=Cupriavidus basilensis TaxID=68895 RepID=UPI0005BC5926|nr:Imm50 family immunity protein [Cupriavidus basilensis]